MGAFFCTRVLHLRMIHKLESSDLELFALLKAQASDRIAISNSQQPVVPLLLNTVTNAQKIFREQCPYFLLVS